MTQKKRMAKEAPRPSKCIACGNSTKGHECCPNSLFCERCTNRGERCTNRGVKVVDGKVFQPKKRWRTIAETYITPSMSSTGRVVDFLMESGDPTVALASKRVVIDIGRSLAKYSKYGRRARLQVSE